MANSEIAHDLAQQIRQKPTGVMPIHELVLDLVLEVCVLLSQCAVLLQQGMASWQMRCEARDMDSISSGKTGSMMPNTSSLKDLGIVPYLHGESTEMLCC